MPLILALEWTDAFWLDVFTDLANPTSNSIYKKIGYQPVCDSVEWDFEKELQH
jgi:hypothetical protein